MNLYAAIQSLGYEVEAGLVRNHDEAVRAWREGRLPTVEPPASPLIFVECVS